MLKVQSTGLRKLAEQGRVSASNVKRRLVRAEELIHKFENEHDGLDSLSITTKGQGPTKENTTQSLSSIATRSTSPVKGNSRNADAPIAKTNSSPIKEDRNEFNGIPQKHNQNPNQATKTSSTAPPTKNTMGILEEPGSTIFSGASTDSHSSRKTSTNQPDSFSQHTTEQQTPDEAADRTITQPQFGSHDEGPYKIFIQNRDDSSREINAVLIGRELVQIFKDRAKFTEGKNIAPNKVKLSIGTRELAKGVLKLSLWYNLNSNAFIPNQAVTVQGILRGVSTEISEEEKEKI
ncbi:hypothetical protein QAD02_012511 [Eretmocerus hayati]|uniref:Uncharacterized protein n=1 Tax=Eretmocerus hayati TaxID=131215 RepID=A0ACC2P065_9HYME|nr:hypothetical protein QAD02_012511 [Eretmocerus hayati]